MSMSVDQVFIKQFEADVHLAYQQMGTKLRSTIRSKSGVVGTSTTFQKIGKGIADLMIRMKDVSREFNDYAHLKSYDEDEVVIIFNSAYANEITYLDLPTIFHKEGIVKKVSQDMLPSRYFGDILAASKTVGATDDVRAMYEQEITVGGQSYHLFAGDKFPTGAVVASGDGYEVNANIIAKVVTKLPPYMSAFEVGTSFFNPRSLTENHYLTFGHNELEHLYAHPFVRVVEN